MIKKSVVITGASSGIGRTCALHLDFLGFRVFAGIRKFSDGQALQQDASEWLTPVRIDVTDRDTIESAAQMVSVQVGDSGLAGLVNNAGIVVAGPLEYVPIDELRQQLETNVVGQISVTQAFLPLLRKGRGRVINIGSVSGRVATPFLGPYAASKFALEALTDSLRGELRPWGLDVVIVQPGPVQSMLWSKGARAAAELANTLPPEAIQLYGKAMESSRRWEKKLSRSLKSPRVVAEAVADALMARRPKTRYPIGIEGRASDLAARVLPDRLRDWLLVLQRGLPSTQGHAVDPDVPADLG